jgi:acetyl-CoA carboxylase/biotin carboxylase 1
MLYLVASGTRMESIPELQTLNYNFSKHIISIRVNSENPYEDFRPSTGVISEIDITYNRKSWGYFSVSNDSAISETVDSQFGHILSVGKSRESAIHLITSLIDSMKIRGTIYNTAGFLKNFVNSSTFRENRHTTRFLNSSTNTKLYNSKYDNNSIAVLGMLYNAVYRFSTMEADCYKKLECGHNYLLRELSTLYSTLIVYNSVLYEYQYMFEVNGSNARTCIIEYTSQYLIYYQ